MIKLKKMLLERNELVFVRYGGLSPVKQKGYVSNSSEKYSGYHSPPARKGIYAFVKGAIEPFLLGADSWSGITTKHSKFQYVKDKDGKKIEYDEKLHDSDASLWTHVGKDGKTYLIKLKAPKLFNYTGILWHHLKEYVKPNDIIDEKNDWIKTDYSVFKKAYYKALDGVKRNNYTKDHLEVFIERIS